MNNKFGQKVYIIFDDTLTDVANSAFQEEWATKGGDLEVVTLTGTSAEKNLTFLEKDNTLTGLKNVVYIGDQPERSKRINTDGGICFSTTEFAILSTTLSNINPTEKCSGINMEQNNHYSYRLVNKIKKLNRIGLYHKKQLCLENYNPKSEK